ncbi:MAG TPA: hypothetical protein VGK99_21490 [Acidobacteriota bacterium]|jgi:hypothetical protein
MSERIGFTPGPWRVCIDERHKRLAFAGIETLEGHWIAVVSLVEATQEHQQYANARLIAAAPEMFEALREALTALEEADDKCSDDYGERPYGVLTSRIAKVLAVIEARE